MSGLARIAIAAEMQGRDLMRRHVALALLVALPLAFYLSLLGEPDDPFTLVAAGIGMGWSTAGAALFSVLAARHSDPRLVLAGYRPGELLLGRLVLLEALALALLVVVAALVVAASRPPHTGSLLAGLALCAWIGVPLGLAAAALLPRELEGTLAIVGVVGIDMSVPPTAAAAPALPFYGASDLLHAAAGSGDGGLGAVAHALAYGLGLLLVAVALWTRRFRVRRRAAAAR